MIKQQATGRKTQTVPGASAKTITRHHLTILERFKLTEWNPNQKKKYRTHGYHTDSLHTNETQATYAFCFLKLMPRHRQTKDETTRQS